MQMLRSGAKAGQPAEGGYLVAKTLDFGLLAPQDSVSIVLRSPAGIYFGFLALGGQWSDEFQANAEAVAIADYAQHPCVIEGKELHLHQISGIKGNPSVERHAAFTHLRATAG